MYKKINGNEYNLVDNIELLNRAEEIVKSISMGVDNYVEVLDDSLLDTIYSRIVASDFVKDNKDELSKKHYIIIKSDIHGRQHKTSIGSVVVESKEYVINGVLYD